MSNPSGNSGLVGDCEALLALKDSTTSTNPLNWSTSTPIAKWDGVAVEDVEVGADTVKRVTSVSLLGHGLSGSLPPELGRLTQLTKLNLDYNSLSGQIPVELGNLTQLRTLNLNSNSLSGQIPTELGNLTQLRTLNLSYNNLNGQIPGELGNLVNLESLWLGGGNVFTGCIPLALADVANNDMSHLGLIFCACNEGVAVSNPSDNPGLVEDCEALIVLRDTWTSTRTLNWGYTTPITEWEGITVKDVQVEGKHKHSRKSNQRGAEQSRAERKPAAGVGQSHAIDNA